MISIARTLGAPDTVPAGKQARTMSSGWSPGPGAAAHVRDQVHDLG